MHSKAKEIAEKFRHVHRLAQGAVDPLAADIDAAIAEALEKAAQAVCIGCWSGDAEFVEWHSRECGCRYKDIRAFIDGTTKDGAA